MDEDHRRQALEGRRRIADTLIQAAEDTPSREQLLADPAALFTPPGQPRREVSPQVDDLRRDIMSHLMDRVANDPDFAPLLRDDLLQGIRTAGLMPQMEQLRAELPPRAEVTGYRDRKSVV